ncbi:glycoside hydrolase family 2 protein [Bacillus sp. J37]|uniref:beta-mannosidase n=1 Tax=Bacillus sp. J37 TaxID=935837 RepID=UPI00047E9839|nr:glycoside hydrolase family 2 protein [Bacillus sp. J37]
MKLNQNWKIQHFDIGEVRDLSVAAPDYIDHFWMTAKVPGDVHSTLIDKKMIEHPFFGHNDLKSKWVSEKIWWYRSEFHYSKQDLMENERLELTFEGLDTFATIYLNGVEIGSTENMFIPHTFEVTREVTEGKNIIAVKFDPVSERLKEKEKNYWAGFGKDRIWARKAQSHFGWDWGPQILTVGIWKDVRLEKRKIAKIDSVFARTLSIEDDKALVQVDVDTKAFTRNKDLYVEMILTDGIQHYVKKEKIERNHTHFVIEMDNPTLWWTHDLGTPHLYNVHIRLLCHEEEIDSHTSDIGIRTIEVMQRGQDGHARFTFVLNGVEIFAKGANWIPIDSFIGPTPDVRYSQLLNQAKEAHMNMMRVWGGGIYEREIFYNECNRLGILVWQDFMFACALYPDYNKNYMENVREEIEVTIKTLRNHPCIAIWCGNNENDWLYEVEFSAGNINTPFYGEKIYHELIPGLLEELDTSRLYWPSSPFGGNDHDSEEEGDRHNWQVWHGNVEPRQFGENLGQNYSVEGVSFKNYKKDYTRFSSEFGMHASANRYTLENNLPEGTFYWGSDEMSYRNKDYHHQKGILLMEGYTGIPTNIEEYMNYSMLTQAEGLKYGIEHYRRNKPMTSGALVWQLNDCWPGTSWSMIDYYLLPKASFYYAKKFFHPLLLSIDHDAGKALNVWVVNDRVETYTDTLELKITTFKGEEIFSKSLSVEVGENVSTKVATFTEEELLQGYSAHDVFISLASKQDKAQRDISYLRDYKDLSLPECEIQVEVNQENQTVTVRTDHFARMVKVEIPAEKISFSDNYFDLLPGESKTIQIGHLENEKVNLEELTVSAMNSKEEGRRK